MGEILQGRTQSTVKRIAGNVIIIHHVPPFRKYEERRDNMKKTVCIMTMENVKKWANVFVTYGEGVRLPLEDMESIFGAAFLVNVKRELADSEPLYINDDGEMWEAVTIPTLIEAARDIDRVALYGILGAVENVLVRVWD